MATLLTGAAAGVGTAVVQYQGREKVALVLAIAAVLLSLPSAVAGLRRPRRLRPANP